jgi:M6 family metalloprotease-like protein
MKFFYTFSIMTLLLVSPLAHAAFLSKQPFEIHQPDGSKLSCFISGDEFFNWLHDENDYTLIQANDGFYYYAISEQGNLVPSTYKAGSVNPDELRIEKGLKISKTEYQKSINALKTTRHKSGAGLYSGTMNNLVIYIKFLGEAEFSSSRQTFDELFNREATNSVKSFYLEASYNKLNICSTHYPYSAMNANYSYTDPHLRSYYEPFNATSNPSGYTNENDRKNREHTLLESAIDWINTNSPVAQSLNIDLDNNNEVDNISFIVKGASSAWSGLLWAHQWALYSREVFINGKRVWNYTFQPESQATVAVLSHEIFHTLGAPDLYHYTDNNTNVSPVSTWDLMANGNGHMGAYMKWKYTDQTWIETIPEITTSGSYSLNPLISATNNCYKIASPNSSNEFFLLEYRQNNAGYEASLPGSGLIVYRINETIEGNADGPPDEVYIYRPNGTINSNGQPADAFYSSQSGRTEINDQSNPSSFLQSGEEGGLKISNISTAGADIQFSVELSTVPNPTFFLATTIANTQIDLEWQNGKSPSNYILAFSNNRSIGNPQQGIIYNTGDELPGGGTILYSGNLNFFSHINLIPASDYFYCLWAVDDTYHYSSGISASQSTGCGAVTLPYSQTFYENGLPPCWSEQLEGENVVSNWEQVSSATAGGSNGEIRSHWQQAQLGTTRLILPVIITTGATQLILSFRHALDAYGSGANLKIQSSSDGIIWTDEAWSICTSTSNIGPELVNTTISSNLNQEDTYIAFVITGNLFKYDFWFIDDVELSIGESLGYSVTTTSLPATSGKTFGDGHYNYGETVTINAQPSPGFAFSQWTENGTIISSEPSYTFTLDTNRNFTAHFEPLEYLINLTYQPSGSGIVTGAGWYDYGSQATINAVPEVGYVFTSWKENGTIVSREQIYTFTVTDHRILTAIFVSDPCYLNLVTSPSEAGTCNGGGAYECGTHALAEATPMQDWYFLGWEKDGTIISANSTLNLLVDGITTLTAIFTQNDQLCSIVALPNPEQGGFISGNGLYQQGDEIMLTATTNHEWYFTGWKENGELVSTNVVYTFVASNSRTLIAGFSKVFEILANPVPEAGGNTSGAGTYEYGENAALQAIPHIGYTFLGWAENGTIICETPSISFNVQQNRSLVALFRSSVGMDELSFKDLTLYPNPASAQFIVSSNNPLSMISGISLIDISGNKVINQPAFTPTDKLTVDTGKLPASVYMVEVQLSDHTIVTKKLIVRH